jgi:hypothetical protein
VLNARSTRRYRARADFVMDKEALASWRRGGIDTWPNDRRFALLGGPRTASQCPWRCAPTLARASSSPGKSTPAERPALRQHAARLAMRISPRAADALPASRRKRPRYRAFRRNPAGRRAGGRSGHAAIRHSAQWLSPSMQRRHGGGAVFTVPFRSARFDVPERRGSLAAARTREAAVDLALKWDVLAVCAVFAFVGAVLLGAF